MILKLRWQLRGGHVHITVFSASYISQTAANCGELVVTQEEWEYWRTRVSTIGNVQIYEAK